MIITSIKFFVFLALTVIIYYICPPKFRWLTLLASSMCFFLMASYAVSFYFVFGTLVAYIGARLIQERCRSDRSKRIVLVVSIALQYLLLFVLKYINIIPNTINRFGSLFSIDLHFATVNLIAPIGISYYTLSLWGYLVDVYRTTVEAEKNYLKLSLFACYYPCLVSGPFIRYPDMNNELFGLREFDQKHFTKSFHRIIYGLFKKIFIADILAGWVKTIFHAPGIYSGGFIIFGVIVYAIQIYCDFSGCMDLVIGASGLYGVMLPENFECPFFSRNLAEFWRRWHITLGLWGKDYIMYPLLKSDGFQQIGKKAKKKFGKKIGKKIPVLLSIFVLWLIIGIWHGASYRYIFAAGILPWIYFSVSELCEDVFKSINIRLHIKTESTLFHLFQSIRTISLMLIIWLFVLAPSFSRSGEVFGNIFVKPSPDVLNQFIDYTVARGQDSQQCVFRLAFLLIALLVVLLIDYMKYKGEDVGERFIEKNVVFRFLILLAACAVMICFGVYGPGYDSVEFIYGGF